MKYKELLSKVQKELNLDGAKERREALITSMHKNEQSGLDCLKCSGRCCTYSANSMNMTNLEALEALVFLEENNLINEDLIERLEKCVEDFRLDQFFQTGRSTFFRKTYTCPFFNFPSWGCGLGSKNKPYGCLAFNPREANQTNGGNCSADLNIQIKRLETYEDLEIKASLSIAEALKIPEDKASIPYKLLEFLKAK